MNPQVHTRGNQTGWITHRRISPLNGREDINSHETAYHFRGLGSWTSDTCLVYDGTTYSYGRPLYDQGDLKTIVTNADAPLYTVKVIGSY